MKNFKYRNPVKILFGEGMIKEISKEIAQDETVFLISTMRHPKWVLQKLY